jgi:ion channel
MPLDESLDAGAVVRVLIGLAVFAAITAWQIRTIVGSPYPGMKAVEAFGLLFPFYLLLFASTYFVMERASAASFMEPLTRTDALYFSVTVFSTVGFGDIAPKSEAARLLLGAVRRGEERRSDTGGDPGDDPGPAASPR